MLENKTFGMISLGCDKNRVDAERLLAIVRGRGCTVTDDLAEAQIVIVNTCAFLNAARKEAIETVLDCDAYRGGRLEKIVVTGCLPEKFVHELFPSLTEADVFLGCNDADALLAAIERSYRENCRVDAVGTGHESGGGRVLTTPLHYAYLKIADGCNNHCTYCLIPKIRGRYRSYPTDGLVAEAASLGELSELILVAQDTTRYGEDLYGKNALTDLIRRLSALDNVAHIRLLYCYPEAIGEELIGELAANPKLVKYLDIPLQHSEDRVLKRMNRKGSRAEYARLLENLRARVPGIALRSTFIAGFPGETAEEAEALASFVREQKLENCGFFAYSREPDTPAYRLKEQIPAREKQRRVKMLYAAQREVSLQRQRARVGTVLRVLCDGADFDRGCFVGRAYFSAPEIDGKVYFHAREAEQGSFYDVKITSADAYDLYGATEDYL